MTYFSTEKGAQIHDLSEDYYLYPDQSLPSALVVGRQDELATMQPEPPTLEGEWEGTFHTVQYLVKLREKALADKLKSSSFRSVAWQIFLGVLPGDIRKWIEVARSNRGKYSELKAKYVVDPHQNEDMSLTVNNPLSQEEKSPWAQFFQDNELRRVILQDLQRTYPGELMFDQPEIQDLMLNILFIFARENPDIDYKQGMHELLAPLVYVFYNDYTLVKDVVKPSSQLVRTIVDMEHLEHDLYWTYVALMKFTLQYYTTDKVKKVTEDNSSSDNPAQLFKRASTQPSTYIVQRLNELQNSTLRKFDPELQQHLQKLAIQPQLYGLRWMRLLFGREFPLRDVLSIWDAVFASPDFAGMVEFTCISMLLYIRDALLCNDHTGCLTLLMRYPETVDPFFFVQRALYLRNPSRYDCPPNLQYKPNKTRLANGSDRRRSSGSIQRGSSMDRGRLGSNQLPARRKEAGNLRRASTTPNLRITPKKDMAPNKPEALHEDRNSHDKNVLDILTAKNISDKVDSNEIVINCVSSSADHISDKLTDGDQSAHFSNSSDSMSNKSKNKVKMRRRSLTWHGEITTCQKKPDNLNIVLQKHNTLEKETQKGKLPHKPLKKSITVSEMIANTKQTAAERVSRFLKGVPDTRLSHRRSSLPVPPKTDVAKIAYEMPEVLPQRRISQILETVPEQVMCLTKRRISSPDIPEQVFLSLEIKPLSELVESEAPPVRSGRRMSLPAVPTARNRLSSLPVPSSAQFISYELQSSSEMHLIKQKRRSSLPHLGRQESITRDAAMSKHLMGKLHLKMLSESEVAEEIPSVKESVSKDRVRLFRVAELFNIGFYPY